MASFQVLLSRKADSELETLSKSGGKKLAAQVLRGLEKLSEDPRTPRPDADILQLVAVDPKMWRLRVGQYRILYAIDEAEMRVYVTTILHRKKAYR
ncbi:MAG: type II toxin-antitoxin system RelE/ParE family toxin [Candidatus Thermoplasmatota archaeon]|nr:type II toxin-antitoxin system RelE/ParE family toxin [Candidatus Thermoplasmatota archaeon]